MDYVLTKLMDTFVFASLVILVNSALQVGDKYMPLFKTFGCHLVWYCQFDVSPVNYSDSDLS